MERSDYRYAIFLSNFLTVSENFWIFKNIQLTSVNIFIVCKRRQNKTTFENPAFFIAAFLPRGILFVQAGKWWAFQGESAQSPCLLTAQGLSISANTGTPPATKTTFFFFAVRSNASELLSDVAWKIQTKTKRPRV